MSKNLYLENVNKCLRAGIPESAAFMITMQAIMERGVIAGLEGYYGQGSYQKAVSAAKTEQLYVDLSADIFDDVRAIVQSPSGVDGFVSEYTAGYGAVHTVSDFPSALAALRNTRVRQEIGMDTSNWRAWIPQRNVITQTDFKQVRGLNLGETADLVVRPEGTDVDYTTFSYSSDGYFMSNYARAFGYTWEMWINDDVMAFERGIGRLGQGGSRTEAVTIFNAIINGVSRSGESGVTTGNPTITNVKNAATALANRTATDPDGTSQYLGLMATDFVGGTADMFEINKTFNSQYVDFEAGEPNPLTGITPHVERVWQRAHATDWILFDNSVDWFEVSFLEGFQNGPQFSTKLANSDTPERGDFDNNTFAVRVDHVLGAKVTNTNGVIRVEGA